MANARPITYAIDAKGCWNCTSHKPNSNGYPVLHRNGKCIHLSRFIYLTKIGPIPDGLVVRHKCDNSLCINPTHLELGTQGENIMDMFKWGRQTNIGTANPRAILNEDDLSVIQKHFSQGKTFKEIAALFDVSTSCIKNVIYGRNWKNAKQEIVVE